MEEKRKRIHEEATRIFLNATAEASAAATERLVEEKEGEQQFKERAATGVGEAWTYWHYYY